MHLLTPAALWYLVLLAVVLLLPRPRRPRTRRASSNIYMWRQLELSGAPRLMVRLRRHWLLVLQTAVLLLLVAALARPVLSAGTRRVALVLDLSASMAAKDGDRTRYARAREATDAVMRSLPGHSRVRVIAARTVTTDLGEFAASDRALRTLLDKLEPGAGSASLDDAIATARVALGVDAELYVVSDQPRRGDVAQWIRVGSPADNIAVTALAVRRLAASPLDAQVLIEVRNFGGSPREVPVTLRHEGTIVARDVVTVEPGDVRTLVREVAQPSGVYTATIDASDALELDNQRFTVLRPSVRNSVLLATSGNFFLERALEANPGLTVRTITPGELDTVNPPTARVVICDRCRDVPAGRAGVLLIPPGPDSGVPGPLRVESIRHPLTTQLDVSDIAATATAGFVLPTDADVLIRSGSAPAVAAYERDGRRVVTMQIDIEGSTLPLHTAFPLLLANAIDWLAEGDPASSVVSAGEPIRWQNLEPTQDAVTTPEGHRAPLVRSGHGAIFAATDAPGVYRLGAGDAAEVFVVNPAADLESDLSAADTEGPARPARTPRADAQERTDLFMPLVLAALVLSTVEWRHHCRRRAV